MMSEAEIMRIFMQIALALEYLHSRRILHRYATSLSSIHRVHSDSDFNLRMLLIETSNQRYVKQTVGC